MTKKEAFLLRCVKPQMLRTIKFNTHEAAYGGHNQLF